MDFKDEVSSLLPEYELKKLSGTEVCNIVTGKVGGLSFRWRDNVIQAVAIAVSVGGGVVVSGIWAAGMTDALSNRINPAA